MSQPERRPTASETFERLQPIIAISAMVVTFVLMNPSFAVALIGVVWLIGTRLGHGRRFLGLTLTEALAWSAGLVIIFLCLAIVAFSLIGPGR